MRLQLSPELEAFREEMRTFFTTQVPQEIRDTVAAHRHVTKEQYIETQRVLNAAGLAVPHWPVEWGGKDWTPLQRHIWREEMQLASVPEPLAFNASMIGPVHRRLRHRRSRRSASCRRRRTSTSGGARASPSPTPAPTSPRCAPPPSATATTGSSTARRRGRRSASTPTGSSAWCRTDPTAEKKQRGISMLVFPMDTPGVTLRPIELIDGGFEVNEVFFEDVRVPAENLVGEENQGWTIRQVPARQRAGRHRPGRRAPSGCWPRPRSTPARSPSTAPAGRGPAASPPGIAEIENELLALELTALRVVANSADGKPHPASSVLKLRGSELQQAATELLVDIAGPLSLASFADGRLRRARLGAGRRRRTT